MTDEAKAKRLLGVWEDRTGTLDVDWEFKKDSTFRMTALFEKTAHLPAESQWSIGTWKVESGVLMLVFRDSTFGPYPDPKQTTSFVFRELGINQCTIESSATGKRLLLVRRQ